MAASKLCSSPLDVSWEHLASRDPEFKALYEAGEGTVHFKDPNTYRQITISTLKVYFNLQIQLPSDRLCPPVPGRFEYVRWITELLKNTSPNFDDKLPDKNVLGLDIGTGASCIYPLLGCASHPNWNFVATEVDDKSYENACQNVQANHLEDRIILRKVEPEQILIDPLSISEEGKVFDFSMCNPPFYGSTAEVLKSKKGKKLLAAGACTGAEVEMVTEGGEIAFVSKMVEQSVNLRDKIRWFSTMLGFNHNGEKLVQLLKNHGVDNYVVTFFKPGQFTKRAGIAWSFSDLRPVNVHFDDAGRPKPFQRILPLVTKVVFKIESFDRLAAWKKIEEFIVSRGAEWRPNDAEMTGLCMSKTDIWSRSARRQAQRSSAQGSSTEENAAKSGNDYIFVARISVHAHTRRDEVEVRWLKGQEERFYTNLHNNLRSIIVNDPINAEKAAA